MSRTLAELPRGSQFTDYISPGVIAKDFTTNKVISSLSDACTTGIRQRNLPAHVVVNYVVAQALYTQSSYREVLLCLLQWTQWLRDLASPVRVAGKSCISQARRRLGWEPLKQLFEAVVAPNATEQTKRAWYRAWRLVPLDGSTPDVGDHTENEAAFGVKDILGIPPEVRVIAMTPLGFPAAKPRPFQRKPPEELIRRERW